MADTDKNTLRKMITEILDGADLQTITAKKVRQQLEDKLDADLTERKKEIDKIVMDVIEEKNEEKSEEEDEASEESEEEKMPKKKSGKRRAKNSDSDDGDDDYNPKGKKGKKADSGDDSDGDWGRGKARKAAPKKKAGGGSGGGRKSGGGTGYTKTCKLSPQLAAVMGEENMARHEVVKKMWAIIKEKNLYDPKNKQYAICNDELQPVFKVKRFRTFGMMKYLKQHFVD